MIIARRFSGIRKTILNYKAIRPIYKIQSIIQSIFQSIFQSIIPTPLSQILDNNMYQSPVYPHSLPHTDFILARTGESFYIRQTEDIFVVGQQFPKIVVPSPNSKRANQHTRNFLQVRLYELMLSCCFNVARSL